MWKLLSSCLRCRLIYIHLTTILFHFLAGSRSSSPGKLLGSGYGGLAGGSSRGPPVTLSSEKRSKIPRSQGCSRETSPNRIGLGKDSPRPETSLPAWLYLGYDLTTVWAESGAPPLNSGSRSAVPEGRHCFVWSVRLQQLGWGCICSAGSWGDSVSFRSAAALPCPLPEVVLLTAHAHSQKHFKAPISILISNLTS